MRVFVGMMLGAGFVLGLASGVDAQGVVDYPPASGHMDFIPPSYVAPGGVGSQYVETFPVAPGGFYQPGGYVTQQVVPYSYRVTPAPRARARVLRGTRTYSRGYNQPPAVYSTPLPQGQLYWPGWYMAPNYTPFSRYQTYGSGYEQSPYGSNFYGGYYKGY